MKKLVFIPAWNEQDSIEAVIGDVREHLPGTDLLVVDDGSTDQTAARARDAGAKVASLPFNQGVGAAHQTAYIYAIANGYEICGQLDGDGQHPAAELARLVTAAEAGSADLVVGSRAMSLFAARYSSEFAEVESLQQAVRAGLTVEELHVTMLPRTEGESFITPLGSAFYIFKTLIVLMVGQLRPKDTAEAKR